mmetsp:Transcript_1504/g.2053  ORF Transcript_1504/g.2053 Transcript_1504/m.2053 type:complete len:105 (+) Transcript_1504:138-452(+)
MSKAAPFNLDDINSVKLQRVDVPAEAKTIDDEAKFSDEEMAVVERLEKLWDNHDGDIEAIYEELGENPGKCLKYPPSNGSEFGQKYVRGYFTYTEENEDKSSKK